MAWRIIFVGTITATWSGALWANDDLTQRQFFEAKIRPVLVEKCQSCHTADDPQSKLSVDSLEDLLRGGTRGPAIIPGKPAESVLVSAVKHGETLKMPAKEKLPAAQIADLVKWIETGAYWPDAKPISVTPTKSIFAEPEFPEEQTQFWAFQPPQRPVIPEASRPGDFRSPVDRFLDVKLAQADLMPAKLASNRVLLRRVTFDLTGLPPSPEELEDFEQDPSPDAFLRVADRLLASPRYGEKWGRHWLDVARYGDSNGLDENMSFANAFRYRDYVVAALNQDKPYDQFVREQIAGDQLDAHDDGETLDQLVATGFLTIGPKMLAEDDPVKMQMDIIDEQVETLGKAFLGMTLGCARCHHHKFDPISMHDYYGLAGIFKSTKTMDTFTVVARWQERPLAPADKVHDWNQQKQEIAGKQSRIDQLVTTTNETVMTEARKHLGDYLLAAVQTEHWEQFIARRTPFGQQPGVANLAGHIILEAEDFVRGNVQKDTTNYGPGIGVLVNQGQAPNFAEYELELPQTGMYQLELRYAAAQSRPCRILWNARELRVDGASKVTGGWSPQEQAWHVEGIYELTAGRHVLRLEQPQAFPHIDKLLLVPVTEVSPPSQFIKLDPDYQPLASLVVQWRKYLTGTNADGDEVIRELKAAMQSYFASPTAAALDQLREPSLNLQNRAAEITANSESSDPLKELLVSSKGPFAIPKDLESAFPEQTVAALKLLREERTSLEKTIPVYPEAMTVSEQAPEDLKIHFRGSHLTLGEIVPRRFPKVMGHTGTDFPSGSSGRRELADWLTRAEHPLTARVMVNRLWLWHFGQGIVRSVDNFGLLGELPTHPELLDWLATEFPRKAWSLKSMHRELINTTLYQRSSLRDEAQQHSDPENRLWGGYVRRRITVEEMRDAILVTTGTLDERLGGSLLTIPNRTYVTSTANVNPEMYRTQRRSLYLPVVRSALLDVFQAYDFADPNVSSGQRQSTTVAAQALFLMNSEFTAQQTRRWVDALLAENFTNDAPRLSHVYQTALARTPTSAELLRAQAFLKDYAASISGEISDADRRKMAWQSFCRALISTNEFVFVE